MAFAIQLLHNLNDKHFRIGYNSPGALASVNHLHLHLLYIEEHLFVEDVVMYQNNNIHPMYNGNVVERVKS